MTVSDHLGLCYHIKQFASNYAEFFARITELFSKLGRAIPQYSHLVNLTEETSSKTLKDFKGAGDRSSVRIREGLISVYQLLFSALHAAMRVFTKSNGGVSTQ